MLDVVLVDLRVLGDAIVAVLVVRGRVERGLVAALRIDAVRGVAAQLEREDARGVGGEGNRLQVEHQLDVLLERVRHADRRARQLARLARAVRGFDALDAALDLAHVVEVVGQAGAVGGAEVLVQAGDGGPEPVEDALVLGAALAALAGRGADAEQLVEDRRAGRASSAADRSARPS